VQSSAGLLRRTPRVASFAFVDVRLFIFIIVHSLLACDPARSWREQTARFPLTVRAKAARCKLPFDLRLGLTCTTRSFLPRSTAVE